MNNRYLRNVLIDGIGEEGQAKLAASKVLVVGAGGLGSPVLYYLAAAGVGTLGIVDYDVVDITNLQRQILHNTNDIGRLKIGSAALKLAILNPAVILRPYGEKLTEINAESIIEDYDFVVDCCDNYATRLLINDVCVKQQKPYSHGAVIAMRGEAMTYVPGAACYRCVFENPPQDGALSASSQVGVLGAVAGIVGSIQATEAIKYIVGMREQLILNRMLIIEAGDMKFISLKVKKNKDCVCG
ncbi:MAG: HesA/MoeB/ThiF family protein [Tannerella sp.]|jgi:adenylyltransferase/sulfurtransferase|nr:HesA/MoeB/ThiF family protein [Tannerella sp.]